MAHIKTKVLGLIVAVLALGSAIVPGVATAEEPAPEPSTAQLPAPAVVSSTFSSEGELTTFSDGTELFTPASPDAMSDCGNGWFCLWENSEYSGRRLQFQDTNRFQYLGPTSYQFSNQASSFDNERNHEAILYDDETDKGGGTRCIPAYGHGNFGAEWNDRASSLWLSSQYANCSVLE